MVVLFIPNDKIRSGGPTVVSFRFILMMSIVVKYDYAQERWAIEAPRLGGVIIIVSCEFPRCEAGEPPTSS